MSGYPVGTAVPPLEHTITLTDMVAYAGATWDWQRMHYDTSYAEAKGLPAPVVDGQVFGAYCVRALTDWLGPDCFVRSLEVAYRNLVLAGERIRCSGEVTEADDHRIVVSMRVEVVGEDGEVLRAAAAPVSAEVWPGVVDGPGAL